MARPSPEELVSGILLTCDPGLEEVAAEELEELRPGSRVVQRPYGFPGQMRLESSDSSGLERLTTVHHVLSIAADGKAEDLDALRRLVASTELHQLEQAKSFRVTAERLGEHPFSSVEVQRAAGAELFRRYGTAVSLDDPQVDVRVHVYGRHVLIGTLLRERSLSKRILRARSLRSALKPTIAAAMLRLAGAHHGAGRLLDPMCGIGTIPIEAKRINPALEVLASDWDPETVDAARETVSNHGLDIAVRSLDARELSEMHGESIDFLVTDPPYGVRQARHTSVGRLYRSLLPAFEQSLRPGGTLAIVVVKKQTFLRALQQTALQLTHEQAVESGGLRLWILVLRRPVTQP